MGGIVGKDGMCHTYDVLDRVCVRVELKPTQGMRSDSIILVGGCYKGGDYAHYTRANPDKIYKFDHIPVEVRSVNDPYLVWIDNNMHIP